MEHDVGCAAMRMALLEVADIELSGCDSMDPVIVMGQRQAGRLTAYAHLRLRSGDKDPFPFDVAPAQRAFHRDGVDLFGICYGVWQDQAGAFLAQPEGFPGRQSGVVTVIGRLGAVTASYYQIIWDEKGYAGFCPPRQMAVSPIGDLLVAPGEDVVVPLNVWKDARR